MSYPRKRALLACDFCRQRKRRCDAKKPVCGNCAEASADCHYQELPLQRLEPSTVPASMSRRLERIETLLNSHSEAISAISNSQISPTVTTVSAAPPTSNVGQLSESTNMANGLNATSPADSRHSGPSVTTPGAGFHDVQIDLPPFTIPPKHQTSTNSLLALPIVKALVGEFPEDYFFRIESQRAEGKWISSNPVVPPLNREVTDLLVATFFSVVHPCHPILDRDEFRSIYQNVLTNGLGQNLESALCLTILALGVVASQSAGPDARAGNWTPGMEYFQPALHILLAQSAFSFSPNLLLPQGLVFGGIYFAYIAQPLPSWKLIHLASTNVQLLLSRNKNVTGGPYNELIVRAYWSCFLVECDRLAEFNLPRSGIETIVDDLTLPKVGNPPDPDKLSYLAEISIRRLLNRVHNSIYNAAEKGAFIAEHGVSPLSMPIASLLTIATELDHQLQLWYESLPDLIRPSLGLEPTKDDRQRLLRIRYYAARHIIHRLFVLYVTSLPEGQEPWPIVLDKAQVCMESCRTYLRNTGEILKKPSQYTWTFSQSSLGAILVLTIASLNRYLRNFVPDIFELQQLVMDNVTRWACPDSSFESVIWIIGDIARKQRFR